ncbi:MAG: hypothetical protein GXP27_02990 [Planctomycetes bacterium]|nr:hypothetical protein [Planctomycetota bacterium]
MAKSRFLPTKRRIRWAVGAAAVMLATFAFSGTPPASGQVSKGEVQQALRRGIDFLKEKAATEDGPELDLAAYAMLVAGAPPNTPIIQRAVKRVRAKVAGDKYTPLRHHIYEAGVDAMLLEEADAKKYQPEIEAIARYLVSRQAPEGYWEYPYRKVGGDTSITQYGALGLWAATRSGVRVPIRVWDRLAGWLLRTQLKEGAFAYWPVGTNENPARREPRHSMAAAGVGSLLSARLHLAEGEEWSPGADKKRSSKLALGVLEAVEEEEEKEPQKSPEELLMEDGDYVPKLKPTNLDPGIQRGLGWLGVNFTTKNPVGAPIYYFYGMERVGALAHVTHFGTHDWYAECASHLLATQNKDGSWHSKWNQAINEVSDTSFALLFLSKSTAKHVKPIHRPAAFGGGLLSGGRGLPEDLSKAEARDGRIEARQIDTPLDKLLTELANPKNLDVETAQQQLVQQIQIGHREELIGKKDLLVKLAKDPRVEVRRTAMWALGRCEDIRLAPILIEGLKDPDLDVAIEARNALCTLSRRPLGFGLPDAPRGPKGGPPDEAAIQKWRAEAVKRWTAWYRSIQPYDERDMLFEFGDNE